MTGKNTYRFLLILALLLLHLRGFSQVRRASQSPVPEQARPEFLTQAKSFETTDYVSKLVLRNGLTIMAEEYRSQPVVSVQAHIQTGSFHEPAGSIGIARLLASLIENGVVDSTRGSLGQNVYALGGKFSHCVDFMSTHFEITAPSSRWKQVLELLINSILSPDMSSAGVTAGSAMTMRKAHLAVEIPDLVAQETLLVLAFAQPRMAKYGEIAESGLQNAKLQILTDFHEAMYTAPKTTFILSGDISSHEVFNEIARLYGKRRPVPGQAFDAPAAQMQSGFRYRQIRGKVAHPRLFYGFHGVPENAEDFRALEVLNAILGTGEGSILNTRLRDQKGIIFQAGTSLLANRNFGYLVLQMEADSENIDRSEIAALTEIELLKRKEPDKADIVRAQAQLELEYWKRRETVSERGRLLACYEALGNWKRPADYIAEIKRVTPSDIRRVANKYLRMNRCTLLEFLPDSGPQRNTTIEGMRQTLEGLLEVSADQESAKREKEVVPFFKIPESSEKFNFSEVEYPFQVASILRGPDMYIREDHTSALIEMGLFFRGGKLMEKKDNAGITNLMTNLMLLGTKKIPVSQFHRQIEMYGARLEPVIADDYFGFMLSVLSENFAAVFDLLQQAIKTPVFEKTLVNRLKEIQKKQIIIRKNSGLFAQDLLNQVLFQDYSYGRNNLGTEASVEAITEASIAEWHGEYVRNRKPYVVIIGNTKGTSLATHFVRHFSGSRIQETRLPEEWTKPLEKEEVVEQSWNNGESLILIGFQAAPVDDDDTVAIQVLEKLIGNQDPPSSNTVKDVGTSGRIFAVYNPRLRGGSFIVGASASPKKEEEMLGVLKQEIQRVIAGPNTYREVRSAVNAAAGEFQINSQMRSEQIRRVMALLLTGRGLDNMLSLPVEMQMITTDDIDEVAPRVLDMKKSVIVRIHGKTN